MKRPLILLIAIFPLLGLISLMHAFRLQAKPSNVNNGNTFTVNSSLDATDINPGNGICETAVGNDTCTLRAAIQETNALPGTDSINLPSGIYTITLPGADFDAAVGDLNITDSVLILGEKDTTTIIDGNNIDQVFDIRMSSGKEVTLANLSIVNGRDSVGGGISHSTVDTMLYLDRVIVSENQGTFYAGGIYNTGYMEVLNSVVQENIGGYSGGGIHNIGIAIIHNSSVISNSAPEDGLGGGIFNKGILTVTNSTIRGNSVAIMGMGSNGGGIFNYTADAEITVENSTISHNTAMPSFGGFVNFGGVARLINVTISENDHGGVLQHSGGATYITNTTIISNTHLPPYSVSLRSNGSVTLVNTIIAGETLADNCYGSMNSLGHNLESGNSCGLNSTGDITNTNPHVGTLQWNGGDTLTHSLLAISPAIDAGDDLACPTTDQRGLSRTVGVHCDIGAYEYNPALVAINDETHTQYNTPVLIDVLVNDIPGPNGNPIMLGNVDDPISGMAIISNTYILYTPTQDIYVATDAFTYTITDGVVTDTAMVTVTIMSSRLMAVPDIATTPQNVPVSIDVLANDLAGDNGVLMFESLGTPTHGTAVISDVIVLYTPALNFAGMDVFTYTITDGSLIDTTVVTVTVPVRIYLPAVLKTGN
ncbi:MAG: hypothetical protein GY803_13245 [Chloroflexi bacterium]|nr:hypothetical protein [Chloroflexota bacterium]